MLISSGFCTKSLSDHSANQANNADVSHYVSWAMRCAGPIPKAKVALFPDNAGAANNCDHLIVLFYHVYKI